MQQGLNSTSEILKSQGAGPILKNMKEDGREKKCCPLCQRHMNNQELTVFEETVSTPLAVYSRA